VLNFSLPRAKNYVSCSAHSPPPPTSQMNESKPRPSPSSDEAVSSTIKDGFQRVFFQAGVGLLIGGMTSIVVARGGASGARKAIAGFGAGAGAGSAWTKCSIEIEELLK
jgi:Domain of unknown function (DUF543)